MQELGALTNPLKSSLNFGSINSFHVRHQSGDGFAVAGDNNLRTLLDVVEEAAKSIFGFEGTNLLKQKFFRVHMASLS